MPLKLSTQFDYWCILSRDKKSDWQIKWAAGVEGVSLDWHTKEMWNKTFFWIHDIAKKQPTTLNEKPFQFNLLFGKFIEIHGKKRKKNSWTKKIFLKHQATTIKNIYNIYNYDIYKTILVNLCRIKKNPN